MIFATIFLGMGVYLTPLLFGVAAVDPATYFVISALLMSTALVAGAIPALRVTSGAPLRALRTDG